MRRSASVMSRRARSPGRATTRSRLPMPSVHRSPLRCRSVPSRSRDSLVGGAGRGDRYDACRDDRRPSARVARPVGLDRCRRPGGVGCVSRERRRAVRHDDRPRRRRVLVYVSEPPPALQTRARPADALVERPDRRHGRPTQRRRLAVISPTRDAPGVRHPKSDTPSVSDTSPDLTPTDLTATESTPDDEVSTREAPPDQ